MRWTPDTKRQTIMFLSHLKDENTNKGAAYESKNKHRIVIPINDDPSKRFTFIAHIDDET